MKLSDLDLKKQYSYADYLNWKLEETVELIRGFIFPMVPSPNVKHQLINGRLTGILYNFFESNTCNFFPAPFDVRLPKKSNDSDKLVFTVVQPDLCVVCDRSKLDENGCNGAPDLIVEILSPGNTRKEMKDKMEVYEESAVREYWIIHPKENYLIIYTLNEKGKYSASLPFVEGDLAYSSIFPDMKIDLENSLPN